MISTANSIKPYIKKLFYENTNTQNTKTQIDIKRWCITLYFSTPLPAGRRISWDKLGSIDSTLHRNQIDVRGYVDALIFLSGKFKAPANPVNNVIWLPPSTLMKSRFSTGNRIFLLAGIADWNLTAGRILVASGCLQRLNAIYWHSVEFWETEMMIETACWRLYCQEMISSSRCCSRA